MRCIAVIGDIDNPGIDNVILWDREGETVAIAYRDGQVLMSRPLEGDTFDARTQDMRTAFGIHDARITRITTWMPA